MLNGTLLGEEGKEKKRETEKEENRSWLSKILFLDSTLIDALVLHNLQSRSTGDVHIHIL